MMFDTVQTPSIVVLYLILLLYISETSLSVSDTIVIAKTNEHYFGEMLRFCPPFSANTNKRSHSFVFKTSTDNITNLTFPFF